MYKGMLTALVLHKGGLKAKCPCCGSNYFKVNFVEVSKGKGFGAFWCEKCHLALYLDRVDLKDVDRASIVPGLPADLKFV